MRSLWRCPSNMLPVTMPTDSIRFGYARVSKASRGDEAPNLQPQIDALLAAGIREDHIYQEVHSGGTLKRPEWVKLRGKLRPGDCIVVTHIDRFSRRLPEAVAEIERLRGVGVGIVSLRQGIDTRDASPTGQLILNLLLSLADFGREDTAHRIREGLTSAKRRGIHVGRPAKSTPAQRQFIVQDLADGYSVRETARRHGLSPATVRNIRDGAGGENAE